MKKLGPDAQGSGMTGRAKGDGVYADGLMFQAVTCEDIL
jgi:hypothetical protein